MASLSTSSSMSSTAKMEIHSPILIEDNEAVGERANVETYNAQIDESPSLTAPSTLPSAGTEQTQIKRKSTRTPSQ
ncbi:hypothetical protein TorRG33x02_356720, partial [Trema orientale]